MVDVTGTTVTMRVRGRLALSLSLSLSLSYSRRHLHLVGRERSPTHARPDDGGDHSTALSMRINHDLISVIPQSVPPSIPMATAKRRGTT